MGTLPCQQQSPYGVADGMREFSPQPKLKTPGLGDRETLMRGSRRRREAVVGEGWLAFPTTVPRALWGLWCPKPVPSVSRRRDYVCCTKKGPTNRGEAPFSLLSLIAVGVLLEPVVGGLHDGGKVAELGLSRHPLLPDSGAREPCIMRMTRTLPSVSPSPGSMTWKSMRCLPKRSRLTTIPA